MGIDRDRGCTIRFHPSGFRVVMYKDAPGEFIDERGKTLTAAVAQKAGFDVDTLLKEKRKNERMAEARARVEEEFSTAEEDIERVMSSEVEGLTVRHMGKGKYAIFDDEGARKTQRSLSKTEAQTLLNDLKEQKEAPDGSTS